MKNILTNLFLFATTLIVSAQDNHIECYRGIVENYNPISWHTLRLSVAMIQNADEPAVINREIANLETKLKTAVENIRAIDTTTSSEDKLLIKNTLLVIAKINESLELKTLKKDFLETNKTKSVRMIYKEILRSGTIRQAI